MGHELNLTLGQNDFNLGWFFISLSILNEHQTQRNCNSP